MFTSNRLIGGSVALVLAFGAALAFALPGALTPVSYAAVATVLLVLTVVVKSATTKAYGTRTLAQLVSGSDTALGGARSLERRF